MAADVAFDLSGSASSTRSLIVPAKAVGEDGDGRFVFLVEKANTAYRVKKQPIRVGALRPDGFEVLDGLSAGQTIATAGLNTLLDGQRVQGP